MATAILLALMHLLIAVAIVVTAARPRLPRAKGTAISVAALLAADAALITCGILSPPLSVRAIVGLLVLGAGSWACWRTVCRAFRALPPMEWAKAEHNEAIDRQISDAEATLTRMHERTTAAKIAE